MALYKKDTADVGCRTKPKNPNMRQKWPEFSRSKVKFCLAKAMKTGGGRIDPVVLHFFPLTTQSHYYL